MKLLVISDTHGKIDKAIEIYKTRKDVDLILHLGDLSSDAKKIESQLGVSVLSVKGNMDGCYSREGYQILETSFGNIFIAHGHMENVKQSPHNLIYKAESLGCKAAFYGHTHVPVFEQLGGIYLLNPGSLTLPLGGRKGSYALVNVTEDKLKASIVYLTPKVTVVLEPSQEPEPTSSQKSIVEAGTLRDMLNNSDRF